MLNQIVGLGVDEPATETALDAALAAIGDDVSCYVAVHPGARPAELVDWLSERGLEPGWGWMSFRRGLEDMPRARHVASARAGGPGGGGGLRPDRRNRLRPAGGCGAVGCRRARGRLGLLARARRRRAGGGRRRVRLGGRRLPRLRRNAARAPGQGRPERAARATHPARPRGGLRRPRHRDGRAPGRPALELVPQHPPRRVHGGGGAGELAAPGARHVEPRDEPLPPQEARAHQQEPRHDEHRQGGPDAAHAPVRPETTASATATRRTRPPSTARGSGRRSPRSGSRRARTPRR